MKRMSKKCSTDQRFIRKRNTTYKIGTLVAFWVYRNQEKTGLACKRSIHVIGISAEKDAGGRDFKQFLNSFSQAHDKIGVSFEGLQTP